MLDACKKAASKPAELVWVDEKWLAENANEPSDNLPIWLPANGETAGFHTWKNARAVETGMRFRPVEDTVREILAWYPKEVERRTRVTAELIEQAKAKAAPAPNLPDPKNLKTGPSAEREQALLAKWAERPQ